LYFREDGRWKMEDGRWKMEDGRWKMEDGRWKMEDGRWKMEDVIPLRRKMAEGGGLRAESGKSYPSPTQVLPKV